MMLNLEVVFGIRQIIIFSLAYSIAIGCFIQFTGSFLDTFLTFAVLRCAAAKYERYHSFSERMTCYFEGKHGEQLLTTSYQCELNVNRCA